MQHVLLLTGLSAVTIASICAHFLTQIFSTLYVISYPEKSASIVYFNYRKL